MSKKKTTVKTPVTEKAEEVKPVAKPVSRLVEGSDAKVLINVFSPGHEPQEFRISIPNIVGAANLLHRSPESVAAEMIRGLRAKFGDRVG